MEERSAQRARRDRDRESEWNCAQLHFWRREGEAEVQARPGQPKPTSIQQQHSGHRLQCTKHRQHSSSSIMGGPGTGGSYPSMPCKPCACVIIVQQITSFVSEVADAGAQAFPTRRSLLTSRRPSVTALHCCWLLAAAGCWLLLCCPSFGHAVGCIQDHRRQTQVGLLLFFLRLFATIHPPPSLSSIRTLTAHQRMHPPKQ